MSVAADDTPARRRVAIVPWGYVLEDYLAGLGLSLERFTTELGGGWLFGYAEALRRAGIEPVVIAVTEQVRRPVHDRHTLSGTELLLLPPPRVLRLLRHSGLVYPDRACSRRKAARALHPLARYAGASALPLVRAARRLGCEALLVQEYEHPRFDACVALGRLLGIRVYGTFQGGGRPETALERLVRPRALRASAGVVIASGREADRVRDQYGMPAERIARVFNPLDLESWRPVDREQARAALGAPDSAAIVAWHGRVALDRKGLDVLLMAWERVRESRPDDDLRLLLVGTGSDAPELRRRLDDRRLPGVVWIDEFVLDRPRLASLLSAADVYVLPSRWEGFPVAVIEAMACGLPVVAADAPGVAEIFEEGEDSGGVVVRVGDAGALAGALERVLADPALRRELGASARARALTAFRLEDVGMRLRELLFP